jgi:hypothetical protein
VAYRESPDVLRQRIEEVERDLAHARAEAARIPALTRERADLRAKLPGYEPAWRRPLLFFGAAGLLLLLLAGGALVVTRRRPLLPDGHRWVPAGLPADVRACAAQLPLAPDFHVVTGFEHAAGDLRATWTLTPAPLPAHDERRIDLQAFSVRLDLEASGILHSEQLGVHAGHPYTSDISICRGVPKGPVTCTGDPPPELPDVLSELSVQDWEAYAHSSSTLWMLVRTSSSALLLRSRPGTTMGRRIPEDRCLCEPGEWQVVQEILLGPTIHVSEQVLLGDPPKPFDCAAWGQRDGRCTG